MHSHATIGDNCFFVPWMCLVVLFLYLYLLFLLTVFFIQVVSVRDIYHSIIDASFKNPQQRRLLRFGLTDGICEAVAIEFSPIPFITEEIAPGTKVS